MIHHLNASNVDDFLADLTAAPVDQQLNVDLAGMESLHHGAAVILATGLLGTLGSRPLRVSVRNDRLSETWLERAGLAFSLANRKGETVVAGRSASVPELDAWRSSWRPGNSRSWRGLNDELPSPLFPPEDYGETPWAPTLFGPDFAAFINPHRSGPVMRGEHPVNRHFWPWLNKLVRRSSALTKDRRDSIVRDIGVLTDELLMNISEHSVVRGHPGNSLVHAALTRGGSGSDDRLYLCFADTGPGIVSTLSSKLVPASVHGDDLLLKGAFEGSLPRWGGGRGLGLPEVLRSCERLGATLEVSTGSLRLTRTVGSEMQVKPQRFNLRGTVVLVSTRLRDGHE